jgi:hypothetical protein
MWSPIASAVLICLFACVSASASGPLLIAPSVPVTSYVEPSHDLHVQLTSLQPNTHYELRVNYIDTFPADFQMRFESVSPQSTARTLLSTEKLMFWTDANGVVVDSKTPIVLIHAEYNGVSSAPIPTIPIRLVLEPLVGNILPSCVPPLILVIVFALFLSLRFALPQLTKLLQADSSKVI